MKPLTSLFWIGVLSLSAYSLASATNFVIRNRHLDRYLYDPILTSLSYFKINMHFVDSSSSVISLSLTYLL